MKNIWIFCLKIFDFLVINFSVYLNRYVFVMIKIDPVCLTQLEFHLSFGMLSV